MKVFAIVTAFVNLVLTNLASLEADYTAKNYAKLAEDLATYLAEAVVGNVGAPAKPAVTAAFAKVASK